MSVNDTVVQGASWPMPKFRFLVDLGNGMPAVCFQEVWGMDPENQVLDNRHDHSPLFPPKMQGISKYGNVTMKRGVFVNDNLFWTWYNQVKMNTVTRCTILVKLLDENGKVMLFWELHSAWPTKITGTDLKSDGNEVAVESLEIAYEQLITVNGK